MNESVKPILRTPVNDASAWTRADIEKDSSWLYALTPDEVSELERAAEAIIRRGVPFTKVAQEDFPLPKLGPKLVAMADELENGRGFKAVRGIPTERLGVEGSKIALWGMGTYMGAMVSQNARGELICSVMDRGHVYGTPNARGYQSNDHLDFHTDNSDVAALLFLRRAKKGGSSLVVSSMTIYNEILKSHPEFLDLLYRGYYYTLRGEGRPEIGPHSGFRIPIYSYFEGRLSCRYVRNGIELGAGVTGKPLTETDKKLLDLVDSFTRREDFVFSYDFEPGDVQFVNNHMVLHDRTEYEDYPEQERKRHLLRLWINLYEGRPLAYEFANRFGPDSGRLGIPPVDIPPEHIAAS